MKSVLVIAGVSFTVKCLKVGDTVVFPGAGDIIASAIRRFSKNHYAVYLICSNWATNEYENSVGKAINCLQDFYDSFGGLVIIPNVREGYRRKGRESLAR